MKTSKIQSEAIIEVLEITYLQFGNVQQFLVDVLGQSHDFCIDLIVFNLPVESGFVACFFKIGPYVVRNCCIHLRFHIGS